jgi:AcrR family transcriptional regulator
MPDAAPSRRGALAKQPVRPPQQERGQRRVDDILDAAAALIAESGPDAVTVGAIATRAGASKGSMYHFFRDRESVLVALVERHVQQLGRDLAAARDASPGPPATPEEAADRFVGALGAYTQRNPDLSRVMAEPSVARQLAAQRECLLDLVEEHAAAIVRHLAPHVPADDVPRIAAAMTALMAVLRNPRLCAAAGSADAARAEGRRVIVEYLRSYGGPHPAR